MLSASPPSVQRFSFTIRNIRNIDQVLVTDVPIPFTGNVPELAQAIIDQQHDPMISVMDLQDGMWTSNHLALLTLIWVCSRSDWQSERLHL